jgi:predicted GNAT family N-acyltransferase
MAISIQPLRDAHDTRAFDCGVEVLNDWLRNTARQHSRKGISRTFVAVDDTIPNHICGFYSLTVSEVEASVLPERLRKKLPRKVPMVLLGRLATSSENRGQRLGSTLLADALVRIIEASDRVGIAAILVDAKDENAVRFYEKFGFLRLPDTPRRLVLSIAMARAALSSA